MDRAANAVARCKAFVPAVRDGLFRIVEIFSSEQLRQFCQLLEASPAVALYVRGLKVRRDVDPLSSHIVFALFRRLVRLRKLILELSPTLAKMVLFDVPLEYLDALQELTLRDTLDGLDSPFNPAHYVRLGELPRLCVLELSAPSPEHGVAHETYQAPDTPVTVGAGASWELNLSTAFSAYAAAPDFLRAFPSIAALTIEDQSYARENTLSNLLGALSEPEDLRMLTLRRPFSSEAAKTFHTLLTSFSSLEMLVFSSNAFYEALLSAIAALPSLNHLAFNPGCDLIADDVRALFSTPDSLPELEKLVLSPRGAWPQDWNVNLFSAKDVREIVEMGKARGVEVSGRLVDWAEYQVEESEEETVEGAGRAASGTLSNEETGGK
ncbi:hypothetical protein JCM8097_008072 [Rhodosporidiobolus ruineniae]